MKVRIIYPTDPFADIPGGSDTCIRDILRNSPDDIRMQLVGVTTKESGRVAGKWHRCEINGREFDFYPSLAVETLKRQMRVPLSLKFTLSLVGKDMGEGMDILQFHRFEPSILYNVDVKKIGFIHTDMDVIYKKTTDIRWRHVPWLYRRMENILVPRMNRIFAVRRDTVDEYVGRYPNLKGNIKFLPTWVNTDIYRPLVKSAEREKKRKEFLAEVGWGQDSRVVVFVGRLDYSKDPLLLVNGVSRAVAMMPNVKLCIVGDGVLRPEIEQEVIRSGLEDNVRLLGVLSQERSSEILRVADVQVLTSVYEGMPRCVLEALGCGLPVVTTDVGEVGLVVREGRNGSIVRERTGEAIGAALVHWLKKVAQDRESVERESLEAVQPFTAANVLENVYSTYRKLAGAAPKKRG